MFIQSVGLAAWVLTGVVGHGDPKKDAGPPVSVTQPAPARGGAGTAPATRPPANQPGFKPYKPKAKSGSVTAVVAAYVALWVILLFYLALLHIRQKKIEGELAELEKRVGAAEGPGSG